ncbi:hypothetical protein FOE78_03790 [Microlunatus elymi]|uniref:Uncharacterized protein n=1 Tax=Microlunatus elymi TaxID=2596828 RepID=A0A516PVG2_9ACTN|nr:hypothetical protein [Microlunatus elymi]QDP95153.1 hypothetical protein FOE78_03790 [Microlunatus elymi]
MTGRTVWVDPAPVRAHVERLLAAGLTKPQIGRRSGLATNTITALLVGVHGRGPSERVRQDTAGRLLAVEPELIGPEQSGWVNPIGTMRRLRALVALGWSVKSIAKMAELPDGILWPTLAGRSRVIRVATRDRLSSLYEQLTQQPAPPASMGATWARNRAAGLAWPLPCVWSGDGIDDPNARPVNAEYPQASVASQSYRMLIEPPRTADQWAVVVEHLLDADPGWTVARVATRFGRAPRTVRNGLRQAGRCDLLDRLTRHRSVRTRQWWALQVEDLLDLDPDLTLAAAIDRLQAPALERYLYEAGRDDLWQRMQRNKVRRRYRSTQ